MRKIKLTQGKYALVSNEDYLELNKYKWIFHKKPSDKTGYAVRRKGAGVERMHWLVAGKGCDHKNRNGIDNRRSNLRKATRSQQIINQGRRSHKKTAGCKGVTVVKDRRGVPTYWIARVTVKGVRKYLGSFKNARLASRTARDFMREHHGEFAAW